MISRPPGETLAFLQPGRDLHSDKV